MFKSSVLIAYVALVAAWVIRLGYDRAAGVFGFPLAIAAIPVILVVTCGASGEE